jgi:hypothetical protein
MAPPAGLAAFAVTGGGPAAPKVYPLRSSGERVAGVGEALLDQAERRIEERFGLAHPAQLAVRDLKLIDGTMARMAESLGLGIADR